MKAGDAKEQERARQCRGCVSPGQPQSRHEMKMPEKIDQKGGEKDGRPATPSKQEQTSESNPGGRPDRGDIAGGERHCQTRHAGQEIEHPCSGQVFVERDLHFDSWKDQIYTALRQNSI